MDITGPARTFDMSADPLVVKVVNADTHELRLGSVDGVLIKGAGYEGSTVRYTWPTPNVARRAYTELGDKGLRVFNPQNGCSIMIKYLNVDSQTGDLVLLITTSAIRPIFWDATCHQLP